MDDWNALIARYRAADAALEEFCQTQQVPAEDQFRQDVDAVPHATTVADYLSHSGARLHMTTADAVHLATARHLGELWKDRDDVVEYLAVCCELIELDDARQAELARIRMAHNIDALGEQEQKLGVAVDEAMDAIMGFRPADLPQLMAKIAFLDETCWTEDPDTASTIVDDVRRLGAEVARG